jgi:YD repeat-containing protein
LVASVVEKTDAVETQRLTMAYNASGDLTRVTDVTMGNLIGRVTGYDQHGRVLTANSISGAAVGLAYSPRGLVRWRVDGAQTTTYEHNAIGYVARVTLPGGRQLGFDYDPAQRLLDVRLDSKSLSDPRVLRSASSDGIVKGSVLHAFELIQRRLQAVVPSAHAQVPVPVPRGLPAPIPGYENPGASPTDPWSIVMQTDGVKPMTTDSLVRRMARAIKELCECDPNGFDRPTLTFLSISKMIASGHVPAIMDVSIPGQSSFAADVSPNQDLVDEVVRRAGRPTPSGNGNLRYYVPNLGRTVGTFAGRDTRGIELIVAPECVPKGRPWKRNEVVSFYPAPENGR